MSFEDSFDGDKTPAIDPHVKSPLVFGSQVSLRGPVANADPGEELQSSQRRTHGSPINSGTDAAGKKLSQATQDGFDNAEPSRKRPSHVIEPKQRALDEPLSEERDPMKQFQFAQKPGNAENEQRIATTDRPPYQRQNGVHPDNNGDLNNNDICMETLELDDSFDTFVPQPSPATKKHKGNVIEPKELEMSQRLASPRKPVQNVEAIENTRHSTPQKVNKGDGQQTHSPWNARPTPNNISQNADPLGGDFRRMSFSSEDSFENFVPQPSPAAKKHVDSATESRALVMSQKGTSPRKTVQNDDIVSTQLTDTTKLVDDNLDKRDEYLGPEPHVFRHEDGTLRFFGLRNRGSDCFALADLQMIWRMERVRLDILKSDATNEVLQEVQRVFNREEKGVRKLRPLLHKAYRTDQHDPGEVIWDLISKLPPSCLRSMAMDETWIERCGCPGAGTTTTNESHILGIMHPGKTKGLASMNQIICEALTDTMDHAGECEECGSVKNRTKRSSIPKAMRYMVVTVLNPDINISFRQFEIIKAMGYEWELIGCCEKRGETVDSGHIVAYVKDVMGSVHCINDYEITYVRTYPADFKNCTVFVFQRLVQ